MLVLVTEYNNLWPGKEKRVWGNPGSKRESSHIVMLRGWSPATQGS